MLDLAGGTTVYLACGVTDLRKSYNGLAAIIKLKFHLDPYSRCMFAFCNRRRTSIKILQWDGFGFWILMKRLDRNAFHWPDTPDELRQVTLKGYFVGRVGAPLTVVHPSQNSGRAAFPHPALCETNRSHYHSYILTYIRGLTSG